MSRSARMDTKNLQSPEDPMQVQSPFDGLIGEEYAMLRLICPAAAEMSRHVGDFVGRWPAAAKPGSEPLQVLEIGCGTGITTLALLAARDDQRITAVDIAPAMLTQAREQLDPWVREGRVRLVESDALAYLRQLENGSFDLIASGYAFHNFRQDYRRQAINEVYRVLRPGGVFINGDRYARDDTLEHLQVIQDEVRHFFATFTRLGRLDLLEQWIVHLFSDESPDHVMPLASALQSYRDAGFSPVTVHERCANNALVSAEKPSR